ncbi:MAG: SPOR domain-containing protein, partial [Bacteroidetes bacterium]|nr:SPOR domain-containing protein [Bacteroidota bacterium]
YYVKAGEFKNKSSALFRIKELQQGNYSSRLMEPTSGTGTYTVAVGEFKDYAKAREQSRAINFILEINTTVEKNK